MTEFKSFYKTVGGNEGSKCNYPTRLDTYGRGCGNNCNFCVDPDTYIFMYDGRMIPIKEVQVGDVIYGIEKDEVINKYRYVKSTVLAKWSVVKPSYRIMLANGTELISSDEHRWLTDTGWKYTYGEEKGDLKRPFLTPKNNLRGFTRNDNERYRRQMNEGKINFEGVLVNDYKAEEDLKVVFVEPYKDSQELIDITTSTGNFIANGCISHNCYARSLLEFRNLWNPYDPGVADIEKIKRKLAKIEKGTILRMGGMTDCFQHVEEEYGVTYETIKEMNRLGIGYLIVTKNALVADDKYVQIYDPNLAHIQISITTTSDEIAQTYDNASLISERIAAIEKLSALGFDVCVRLSPFIPQQVDFDILNNIKCDKILVEFLRVNSAIKKIFDLDYSEYSLRQGNYWHLPLEKKKQYLAQITGFKELSVCEDENEAYEYWKENVNYNKEDCCNLRKNN